MYSARFMCLIIYRYKLDCKRFEAICLISYIIPKLYWVVCSDIQEANYLLAIINSDTLYAAAAPLMPKGQWGARDLQKHLWRLPIPEFDASNADHVAVSEAGRDAAAGVDRELGNLRQRYPQRLTVTIARREIRRWLRESSEGKRVEGVVGVLLGG